MKTAFVMVNRFLEKKLQMLIFPVGSHLLLSGCVNISHALQCVSQWAVEHLVLTLHRQTSNIKIYKICRIVTHTDLMSYGHGLYGCEFLCSQRFSPFFCYVWFST